MPINFQLYYLRDRMTVWAVLPLAVFTNRLSRSLMSKEIKKKQIGEQHRHMLSEKWCLVIVHPSWEAKLEYWVSRAKFKAIILWAGK